MKKWEKRINKKEFGGVLLLCVSLTILLAGCGERQVKVRTKAPEPVACVIMIDGTGSYEHIDKAKATARKVIGELPPGSKVYVRWITENSQSDKSGIISAQLPAIEKPKNSFDMREKQRYAAAVAKIKKQRQEIFETLSGAVSPKAMRTDIYGALAAAGMRFEGNGSMKPILVLMTDMDDNVRKTDLDVILNNASVRILDFQVGQNDAELKTYWRQYLSSRGAGKVDFAYLDDPYKGGK